jgi:hypothetical protein
MKQPRRVITPDPKTSVELCNFEAVAHLIESVTDNNKFFLRKSDVNAARILL